jgi:hypothetical protein
MTKGGAAAYPLSLPIENDEGGDVMYLDGYIRLALGRERMERLHQEAAQARLNAESNASEQQERRSRLALRQALRRAGGLAQARAR